jgi:hypothetical protein
MNLKPLNPLHYNKDRVMIVHELVPDDRPMEGVFWCKVCGGHPSDKIHKMPHAGHSSEMRD